MFLLKKQLLRPILTLKYLDHTEWGGGGLNFDGFHPNLVWEFKSPGRLIGLKSSAIREKNS